MSSLYIAGAREGSSRKAPLENYLFIVGAPVIIGGLSLDARHMNSYSY